MTLFKSIKDPMRMSETIAREIEKKILRNELKLGFTLPSEAALREQFGSAVTR